MVLARAYATHNYFDSWGRDWARSGFQRCKRLLSLPESTCNGKLTRQGEVAYQKCGKYIPEDLLESIRRNKVAIKGPITTPIGEGFASINVLFERCSISMPISDPSETCLV